MKHEMTASEYAYQRARCCRNRAHCDGCPLEAPSADYECSCSAFELAQPEEAVRLIAEWAAENPDETLRFVGDGIYFDPQHKIVPDEMTRVYTIEYTVIDNGGEARYIKGAGDTLARNIKQLIGGDDVRCIRAQQFITKCHEEEI